MQTVNFTCGLCGQLMAVSQEFLGQQVRCPHCQQVVLTSAPDAPPPPAEGLQETTFSMPPPGEPESIFSPTDVSEDVFGGPSPSRIEMPPEPPPAPADWPNLELAANTDPLAAPPSAGPDPTLTYSQQEPTPASTSLLDAPAVEPNQTPTASWMSAAEAPAEPPLETGLGALPTTPTRRRARSSGWFIALVMIPLISYAVLATVAIIWLLILMEQYKQPHPLLRYLPDLEGDFKGATRNKSSRLEVDLPAATTKLPPDQVTTLGQPIRIGDLQVTPRKVELRRIWINTPGFNPTEGDVDSLVLHLQLENTSADVVFRPMDPYFVRQWKMGGKAQTQMRPYTHLEIGDKERVYGGPIHWTPVPAGKPPPNRETVFLRDGDREIPQNIGAVLNPGEKVDTFICTDYKDNVSRALTGNPGPFLWRVQLRQGLVTVGDRDIPATAVIGVEFTDKEIQKPG
jgi:hypothetical protein